MRVIFTDDFYQAPLDKIVDHSVYCLEKSAKKNILERA